MTWFGDQVDFMIFNIGGKPLDWVRDHEGVVCLVGFIPTMIWQLLFIAASTPFMFLDMAYGLYKGE